MVLTLAVAVALVGGAPALADIAPDPEDVDAAYVRSAAAAGLTCDAVSSATRAQGAEADALRSRRLEPTIVTCRNGLRVLIANPARRSRWDRSSSPAPVVRRLNEPSGGKPR